MDEDDYRMICGEENISVTEMEILYGAFRKDATLGNCVFCFRDGGSYSKLSDAERTLYGDDDAKTEKLRQLKRKILAQCEKQGDGKIINYHIDLEGDYSTKLLSLSSLTDELVSWFSSKIEDMEKSACGEALPDELTKVNAFISRNEKHYVERKGVEKKILDYIVNGDNGFIVLSGESGCGKSCTLSRIFRMLGQNASFVPIFFSTEFFPRAVNATEVLKSYTLQLEHHLGQSLPRGESCKELQDAFKDAIDKVIAGEKQVVLLLDAADGMQRDVVSRNLAFVPDGIAAVVSVSNGSFADYGTFHSNCHHIKMPCFNREESLAFVDSIMGGTRFHLDAGQKELLLLKKTTDGRTACESPLWTYLAMNLILNLDYFDFNAARGGEIAQGHEEGDYAAFLRRVSRGNVDAVSFVKLLIEMMPATPEELLGFFVDKAHFCFGMDFVNQYLSFLCISKEGFALCDFEMFLGKAWDVIRFTHVHQWFLDVIYSCGKSNRVVFRHGTMKRTLEKRLRAEIKEARGRFVDLLRPLYKKCDGDGEASYAGADIADYRFREYLQLLLESGDISEIASICSDCVCEDFLGDVIVERLKGFEQDYAGSYKPLWFRLGEDAFDATSLSSLEMEIVRLTDIKLKDCNDYLWMLCYHVGIRLMKEAGCDSLASALFFILSRRLEELSHDEDLTSAWCRLYGHKIFHNMLVMCYGNLSAICNSMKQFRMALYYLNKRRSTSMKIALVLSSEDDRESIVARFDLQYGTIIEEWLGLKAEAAKHYQAAIERYERLRERRIDPNDYLFCRVLVKMSAWYAKKNLADKARDFAVKAYCASKENLEKIAGHGYGDLECENSKAYFDCTLHLIKLLESDAIDCANIVGEAWKLIQDIYPRKYGSGDFRAAYVFLAERANVDTGAGRVLERTATTLKKMVSEATSAYRNKRKNLAIRKFIECEQFATEAYRKDRNSYMADQIAKLCLHIGYLYSTKRDKDKYPPLSNEYLLKAVQFGYVDAYVLLALNAREAGHADEFGRYLHEGVKADSIRCCAWYAIFLLEKGEVERGREHLEKAVLGGDEFAVLNKAIFLFNGDYGYGECMDVAISLLDGIQAGEFHDQVGQLLELANQYANQYFEWGMKCKLPHPAGSLPNNENGA